MYGTDEKFIQNFSRKTSVEETTWKNYVHMTGY